MSNFNNFVNDIISLKKSQQYDEALKVFKKEKCNFDTKQILDHNLLLSSIIMSLRKTNNVDAVFKFVKIYNINIDENLHEMVLNAYGWAVYDKYKKDTLHQNVNKHSFLNLFQNLIPLLVTKKSDYSYSVLSNIFKTIIKTEKENQNKDYKYINDFCNIFDPNTMSKETSIVQIKNKDKEIASDFESWYQNKSKALFELEDFQECYKVSKLALENIDSFHYNNDLWFARRIALSKKEFGNTTEAIEDLEKIFKKKKEWFIQKELADLYFEVGNIKKSFEYAIEAICTNGFGKLEFKIGLIFLLGKILKAQKKKELAYKHFTAIRIIREQHEWKITQELQDELDSTKVENTDQNPIKELIKYWKAQTSRKKENILTGTIKRILHNNEKGKNGFLTSNDVDYYFTLPFHLNFTKDVELGSTISFISIEQESGKKKAKIIKVNN